MHLRTRVRLIAAVPLTLAVTVAASALARPGTTDDAAPATEPAAVTGIETAPGAVGPLDVARDTEHTTVPEPDERDVATQNALRTFAPAVRTMSHPDALRSAFRAYFYYRAARPEAVRNPYFYFVDMGLNNRTARGWVFDMERLQVVDGPFTVAHGTGSSRTRDAVPSNFSNRPGSKASSLGLYLAQETYSFRGKSGGRAYTSVGLRMRGESGSFNDAARRRGIVAHGAPYVTASAAGRSEGCPAMEQHRARKLLPMLANGGIVFLYSPNDNSWLDRDPWLNAE